MHMSYRLKLEKMIENHELNKEMLVHCIAVINKKINRTYKKYRELKYKCESDKKWEAYRKEHPVPPYYSVDDIQVENAKRKFDELVAYRKPILDVLMKGYAISLDTVKTLVMDADDNKLPTQKTVDTIRDMIVNSYYKLT